MMKKLLMSTIFVFCILVLSAAAVPASAGVEPSPFKDKTILNRIRAAQNKLGPVISMLDQIRDKVDDLNQKGMTVSVTNKVEAMGTHAYSSLRTLEESRSMFTGRDEPSYEYAEELAELEGMAEMLEDKVQGLSWDNIPMVVLISLRDLGIIIDDIQTAVNEFMGEIYGQNVD
jgi:hypothetical protein